MRQRDGREPRFEGVGHDLEVVDADDRAVGRHREPEGGCRLVDAHGHLVVEAEHRGRAIARRCLEEPAPGVATAAGVGAPALHGRPRGIEPGVGERRPEARLPPAGRRRVIRRRSHRDAPVARGDEVADRRRGDAVLVGRHRRNPPAIGRHPVDEHDRCARQCLRPGHLLVGHARDQDPVDAMVEERANLLRLEAGVALGVDDHQHHAALPRRVLRALHDAPGERGRGDAIAHESDHARALQPEPARDAVRGVAEDLGRTDDAVPRLGSHRPAAAQRVRDRGRRDAGRRRDRPDART